MQYITLYNNYKIYNIQNIQIICVYIGYLCHIMGRVLGDCWTGVMSQVHATDCLCLPKIRMLRPSPQCDGIRRWGLWEVIRS